MACVVVFQTMDEVIDALGQMDALHAAMAWATDGSTELSPWDDYFMAPYQVIKKADGPLAFLYFTGYKVRELHRQALAALRGARLRQAPQLEALVSQMQRRHPGRNDKRMLRQQRWCASGDDITPALYQKTVETCAALLGVAVPADWSAQRQTAAAHWMANVADWRVQTSMAEGDPTAALGVA